MKTCAKSSFLILLALTLVAGCSKSEPPVVDTTPTLLQAFETAAPNLKQSAEAVATNLKAKNYTEATKGLEPLVASPQLTDPQKQAILVTIQQISESIAGDPKLDTPEMAALRSRMFSTLRRGSR